MLRAAPKSPEPPAATLNRIALNPAAALGAPQGIPRHGAARLPTGEKIFPARAMKMPFGAPAGAAARQTGAQVRAQIRAQIPAQNPDQIPAQIPAQTDPANLAARTNANDRPNTGSRAAQGTEQIDSPLARSRRQQADLMLAQWAAQQMAQQNGASAARRAGNDDSKGNPRGAAAQPESPAHPMLAPPNASPEWYAQAMDKALNRYRTGSQAQPIAGPASRVSITR